LVFGADAQEIIIFRKFDYGGENKLLPVQVKVFYVKESKLKLIEGKVRKKVRILTSAYNILDYLKFDSLLLMYEINGKLIPLGEDNQKLMEYDELLTIATKPLEDQILYLRTLIRDMFEKRSEESSEVVNWVRGVYDTIDTLKKTAVLAVSQRFDLLTTEMGFNVTQSNVGYILNDIANKVTNMLGLPKQTEVIYTQPDVVDVPQHMDKVAQIRTNTPLPESVKPPPSKPTEKASEDLQGVPKQLRKKVQQQIESEKALEGSEEKDLMPKFDEEGLESFMQDIFSGKVQYNPKPK